MSSFSPTPNAAASSSRRLPAPPPPQPPERPFSPSTSRPAKALKDFFLRQVSSSRPPATDGLPGGLMTKGRQALTRDRSRSGTPDRYGLGLAPSPSPTPGPSAFVPPPTHPKNPFQPPSLSRATLSQPLLPHYPSSPTSHPSHPSHPHPSHPAHPNPTPTRHHPRDPSKTIKFDPDFGEYQEGEQDTYGRLGLIAASAARTKRGQGVGGRVRGGLPIGALGRVEGAVAGAGMGAGGREGEVGKKDEVKNPKRTFSSFIYGKKKEPLIGSISKFQLNTTSNTGLPPTIRRPDLTTPNTARGLTATRGGPSSYAPARRSPIPVEGERTQRGKSTSPPMSPSTFRTPTPASPGTASRPGSRLNTRKVPPVTPSRSSSRATTIPVGGSETEKAENHYTLRVATTYLVKNLLPSVRRRSGSQEPTIRGPSSGTRRRVGGWVGEEEEVRKAVEERLRSLERMERAWGIEWMQRPVGGAGALSERTREKERRVVAENLGDGVVLCFLLNSLNLGAADIPTIPISRKPGGETNLLQFITACRSLSLSPEDSLQPSDLADPDEQGINRVCRNIIALAKVAGPAVHGSMGLKEKEKPPAPVGKGVGVDEPRQGLKQPKVVDVFTTSPGELVSPLPQETETTPTTPTRSNVRLFDRRVASREGKTGEPTTETVSRLKPLPALDLPKHAGPSAQHVQELSSVPSAPSSGRNSPGTPIGVRQDRRKILIASRRMSETSSNGKKPILRVKPSITPSSATGSSSFLGAKSETDTIYPMGSRPTARRVPPSSDTDSTPRRDSMATSVRSNGRSISFDMTRSDASRSEYRKSSAEPQAESKLPTMEPSPVIVEDAGTVSVLQNLPSAAELAPAFARRDNPVRRHTAGPETTINGEGEGIGLQPFPRQSVEDLVTSTAQKAFSTSAVDMRSPKRVDRPSQQRTDTKSEPSSPSQVQTRPLVVVRSEGQATAVYQLGNVIGRGQFGVVYRALNVSTGQFVAIKRIDVEGLKEEEVTQLMREVDLLKRLSHPSIVKYEGMTRDAACLNIVLEYIEGGSMGSTLRSFGRLNEQLVAGYVGKILEGLNYLHEQDVVHCDLKAANILTTKRGNIKLSDFGVSLNLRAVEKITNEVAGSPNWMAPEVIELKGATTASDIWSLGCTVIELLTGKPPHADVKNGLSAMYKIVKETMPLPDGCSKPCIDFLKACFNKDPSRRPTAEALFEHEWVVWGLGFDQNIRPQDSIPFLRRISTDSKRIDSQDLFQLRTASRSDEAVSTSSRPVSGVTTASAKTKSSGSDRTSRQRSIRVERDMRVLPPHKLVETTFKTYVTCKICQQTMKKHAVICYDCGLISHAVCAQRQPSLCTGGSAQASTRMVSSIDSGDDSDADILYQAAAGIKPIPIPIAKPTAATPQSRERARSAALAKLVGSSGSEGETVNFSTSGSPESGSSERRRRFSMMTEGTLRSSFQSMVSSRPSGEMLSTPVDVPFYQGGAAQGEVMQPSGKGRRASGTPGNGEQCRIM